MLRTFNTLRMHNGYIRLKSVVRNFHSNFQNCSSYEGDGKTTVTILNKSFESGLLIDSYSQVGFRLNNGMFILGPVAIFPTTVLSWNISGPNDINLNSLSLFLHLEPKLDLLVIGYGDTGAFGIKNDFISYLTRSRINVELLPTYQACSTFNFLNAEGRHVAGALIPPQNVEIVDNDIINSKIKRRKLLEMDD